MGLFNKKQQINDQVSLSIIAEEKKKGKTPEQCRCIDFLYNTSDENVKKGCGCLKKKNSDMDMDEYLAYVQNMVNNLNLKQRAIEKIGLDETQISEIPPVHLSDFIWEPMTLNDIGWKSNKYDVIRWEEKDGVRRVVTNKYYVTWIFFSATQIYTYTYVFDTISDNVHEFTRDFFYKDVTCIRTEHKIDAHRRSIKKKGCGCFKKPEKKYYFEHLHYDKLQITVPNDSYSLSIRSTDTIEQSIQATKAMIREKKEG